MDKPTSLCLLVVIYGRHRKCSRFLQDIAPKMVKFRITFDFQRDSMKESWKAKAKLCLASL